jgi:hypothetical protein
VRRLKERTKAKLDQLVRNVAFIADLVDAGVELLACDQPFTSRLALHILPAVAEDEFQRMVIHS